MSVIANHVSDVEVFATSDISETRLARALYELGLTYATGHGVEPSLVEAHKWFNLATIHGNHAAEVDREEVARELSAREIREALKLAREWNATH